jgi:elongation factor P
MIVTPREFRRGMIIELENDLWVVEDFQIQSTAQRKPIVETRLRSLRSGRVVERSLDEHVSIEAPEVQTRQCQYLYFDGSNHVFMDLETYEELTIPKHAVAGKEWLLRDGAEFPVRLVGGQPVQVVFPHHVVEEVVETGEAVGSGASNVLKEARLASGIVVKVPQFIKVGDRVKIDVETLEYMGKESAK